MNIHSKIPHGLLRSGRARSPACPVLGLKGLGCVPIVGTCADLDGGDRSLAWFAASAHRPRSESWHLFSEEEHERLVVQGGERDAAAFVGLQLEIRGG